MKGVSFLTDNNNKRKAVVIDFKFLKKHHFEIEDLLDVIIAESRMHEESIPFENVVKSLRRKNKI